MLRWFCKKSVLCNDFPNSPLHGASRPSCAIPGFNVSIRLFRVSLYLSFSAPLRHFFLRQASATCQKGGKTGKNTPQASLPFGTTKKKARVEFCTGGVKNSTRASLSPKQSWVRPPTHPSNPCTEQKMPTGLPPPAKAGAGNRQALAHKGRTAP